MRNFVAVGSWVSILWGVKFRHLPLTWPVAVNTVLALPRSLWSKDDKGAWTVDLVVTLNRIHTASLRGNNSRSYRQQSRPRQDVEFNSRCCRFLAGFGNSRLSTQSTELNSTLSSCRVHTVDRVHVVTQGVPAGCTCRASNLALLYVRLQCCSR